MPADGLVFQINISNGGVPKLAVPRARVDYLGVEGDRQNSRQIHGGAERAVCLYTLENILALQAKGHPIYPGAIGENLTLSGVNWQIMVPGSRWQVGDVLQLEVTRYTSPCNQIRGAFLEENYGRVSQTAHPGWSRVYARVLQPGSVSPGDKVYYLGNNPES